MMQTENHEVGEEPYKAQMSTSRLKLCFPNVMLLNNTHSKSEINSASL